MSLRRRLALVLVALGVLSAMGLLTLGFTLQRIITTESLLYGPYFRAVVLSNERIRAQLNQETGLRGYQLSADPEFLQPYEAGVAADRDTTERLRTLMAADPSLTAVLDDAAATMDTWRREIADPRIALVRRNGSYRFTQAELEASKARFDAVRAGNDRFEELLLARRAQALTDLREASRLMVLVLSLAAAATLLCGVLLWRALRRWVTGPLTHLGAEVRTVQDGDLEHPIAAEGPTEIEELAADVEGMRQRVVTLYSAAIVARRQAIEAQEQIEEQALELRRSNRDLEQFAYVASHDLQEPLRKVSSFCQMLERRYKGQLDERADQYIGFAVDGAKRMQVLINDLLAFSRLGRVTTGFSDVDLNDCYDQALRVLETPITEAGATVTRDELPTVHGEASLLTQLFQNLIGNAVKFRGETAPRVHVGVGATPPGAADNGEDKPEWELYCSDNGIGIDPQYADKIFVIFQRLHAKEEYGGTGIGLALCKKIVEYHGGRLWLDTSQSRTSIDDAESGTTLRWSLPVSVSSATTDAPTGPVSAMPPLAGIAGVGDPAGPVPQTPPAPSPTGASS